jgi:hypothetical protein
MKSIRELEIHLERYRNEVCDLPTYNELTELVIELKDIDEKQGRQKYLDGLVSKKEIDDHNDVLLRWGRNNYVIYTFFAFFGIILLLNIVFKWF